MVDDRDEGGMGSERWLAVESGGGTGVCPEVGGGGGRICGCKKEPSNISARDDRATERPGDHLKYLVAGRKLSGTGSR